MIKIKDNENIFVHEIQKARKEGKMVYILGSALGAVRIAGGLRYRNLDFDAFVVDPGYYEEGKTLLGKHIYCLDDVMESDCMIIRSVANYLGLERLKEKAYLVDEDVLSLSMVASDPFDNEFIKTHIDGFNSLYEILQDDKSRQVMEAYLNQKITGRFKEMEGVWDGRQYFSGKGYRLSGVGCIVDCGAYIGDSFLAFCDEYEKTTGSKYRGKAYLLDPDEHNQQQIRINCQNTEADIKCLKTGAWNQKGTLAFQSDENQRNAGKIDDLGDVIIQVDTIDNIVKDDKVDFIKMDIEGAELNALKGAARTIVRDRPVLAVCVYHKREDLLEIPSYIHSLYDGYQFYIRAYGGPYSIELVLFAVAGAKEDPDEGIAAKADCAAFDGYGL